MSKITFVLFSYNDANRIEFVIRNFQKYGTVLVFDDHSTDNTKEVVEKMGVSFIVRPKTDKPYIETPETYAFVKQYIKTPWLYWGWTDNLLPKALLEKMVEISEQSNYKYVYLPVYTYLWGDVVHEMARAKYPLFYMPEYVDFSENRVHSLGKFLGKPEEILYIPDKLEFAIRHFSLYTLDKFVAAHIRYAGVEVAEKRQDGKKFSLYYMFGSMANYFYIFYRRAYRAGVRGLYVSMLYAYFRLMVAVKLYEEEHGLTLESIDSAFAKEKKKIVEEIENAKK